MVEQVKLTELREQVKLRTGELENRRPPVPSNLFINDLDINENELTSIIKFADDTTFLVKVCKGNFYQTTRKSVSSGIQTPRSCASFFQPTSRGLNILMKHSFSCLI